MLTRKERAAAKERSRINGARIYAEEQDRIASTEDFGIELQLARASLRHVGPEEALAKAEAEVGRLKREEELVRERENRLNIDAIVSCPGFGTIGMKRRELEKLIYYAQPDEVWGKADIATAKTKYLEQALEEIIMPLLASGYLSITPPPEEVDGC